MSMHARIAGPWAKRRPIMPELTCFLGGDAVVEPGHACHSHLRWQSLRSAGSSPRRPLVLRPPRRPPRNGLSSR